MNDSTLKGYFVLSGAPDQELLDAEWFTGNHTRTNLRGAFGLYTDWEKRVISIPSRDKQVVVWAENHLENFSAYIEHIDAQDGVNYRAKLLNLLTNLPCGFKGVLNNVSTSTHGSLALLGDFHYLGVLDQQQKTSYLVWSDSKFDDVGYFGADCEDAKRFLIYRFPRMPVVFLPSENVCAKWRKWAGAPLGPLLSFNALEKRLCR